MVLDSLYLYCIFYVFLSLYLMITRKKRFWSTNILNVMITKNQV